MLLLKSLGQNFQSDLVYIFDFTDNQHCHEKIKNIHIPVLVMHGKKDSIVPFEMGEKIYNSANSPKSYYFTEYDDHMMDYNKLLLEQLKLFVESLN